jgi:hypothetical protein
VRLRWIQSSAAKGSRLGCQAQQVGASYQASEADFDGLRPGLGCVMTDLVTAAIWRIADRGAGHPAMPLDKEALHISAYTFGR